MHAIKVLTYDFQKVCQTSIEMAENFITWFEAYSVPKFLVSNQDFVQKFQWDQNQWETCKWRTLVYVYKVTSSVIGMIKQSL